jgi:hypothetical protein
LIAFGWITFSDFLGTEEERGKIYFIAWAVLNRLWQTESTSRAAAAAAAKRDFQQALIHTPEAGSENISFCLNGVA